MKSKLLFTIIFSTVLFFNCYSQTGPSIICNPNSTSQTIDCGDSVVMNFTVYNTGTSNLVYTPSIINNDTVKVLVFMSGVDTLQEYLNTINIILQNNPRLIITKFYGNDTSLLAATMAYQDILLFPENESLGNVNYSLFSNVIKDITSKGKTIIICGSSGTLADRIFEMNLFTGSFVSNYSGFLQVNSTYQNDPILNQVPSSFFSASSTSAYSITNADVVPLVVNAAGNNIVFYRNIGLSKAICIGFDYFSSNPSTSKLLANAINSSKHYENTPEITNSGSLNILPGDSTVISVLFNSLNLEAGLHQYNLLLSSNDTVQSELYVPIEINLNLRPRILVLSDCSHLDTVYINETSIEPLNVMNLGCDSLRITGIQFSDPGFSCVESSFIVPPSSSYKLNVIKNIASAGILNGTVTFYSNDIDTTVCLSTIVLQRPSLEILLDTIHLDFDLCQDSIVFPIYIHNTGLGQLDYSFFPSIVDSSRILAYYDGSDLGTFGEYKNTIKALKQITPKVSIDSTNTGDSTLLATKLQGKNVLLFIEQENASNVNYSLLKNTIKNYLDTGGVVIFCSDDSYSHRLTTLNLFTGSYSNITNNMTFNILNSSDPIVQQVLPPFVGITITFPIIFSNPDIVNIVSQAQGSAIAYRNIGYGKVIYLGFDYSSYNLNMAKVLANSVKLSNIDELSGLIHATPQWGSVSALDSQLINITVFKSDLMLGNFSSSIKLSTNDPNLPVLFLPINVTVDSLMCPDFSENRDSCKGLVAFTSNISGVNYTCHWDFGDGTVSNAINPSHVYNTSGNYNVVLQSTLNFIVETKTKNIYVNHYNPNITRSGSLLVGQPIQFTAGAAVVNSCSWDFGDGTTANTNPVSHTYTSGGTYVITNISTDNTCIDTSTMTVVIGVTGIDQIDNNFELNVNPNPFKGELQVKYSLKSSNTVSVILKDLTGRIVEIVKENESTTPGDHTSNIKFSTPGLYLLELTVGNNTIIKRVVSL
jgi:PKD repeat protein